MQKPTTFYNEIDPKCCAWISQLMDAGLITPGVISDKSIEDLNPDDLRGYERAHFFAGIAVWDYALNQAQWPNDSGRTWTGSCPCQSFSASGKGEGFSDKRHLWPSWFRLISECKPDTIFGEQVAAQAGLAWLDVVSADLEGEGYAIGTADLCAASVGAPHIRQRLFFVAHPERAGAKRSSRSEGRKERSASGSGEDERGRLAQTGHRGDARDRSNASGERVRAAGLGSVDGSTRTMQGKIEERERFWLNAGEHGTAIINSNSEGAEVRARLSEAQSRSRENSAIGLGDGCEPIKCSDSDGGNASAERLQRSGSNGLLAEDSGIGESADAEYDGHNRSGGAAALARGNESQDGLFERDGSAGNGDNPEQSGLEGHGGDVRDWRGPGWLDPITARSVAEAGATRGFWADCDWWYGRDGKYRPIGPGLFPLVTGASHRMVKLRGYGNAINAEVATEFIKAYLETERENS